MTGVTYRYFPILKIIILIDRTVSDVRKTKLVQPKQQGSLQLFQAGVKTEMLQIQTKSQIPNLQYKLKIEKDFHLCKKNWQTYSAS